MGETPQPATDSSLPADVIVLLVPYVDEASLRSLRARTGAPWRWLPALFRQGATTIGRNVLFRDGRYRTTDARGLALIAHEAVHVRQYRELGVPRFLARYAVQAVRVRFVHHAHPLEREPLAVQARVRTELTAQGW